MEVKEDEDQPPNGIKIQETFVSEEDRISNLPECLIIEILSRLEFTREAIRTGILSKRWLHLWLSVPFLSFEDQQLKKYSRGYYYQSKPLREFYPSVDKTLAQFKNLNKFRVNVAYFNWYKSHVDNWITRVTSSNAQQLHLYLRVREAEQKDYYVLKDDSFFINPHFTHLSLEGCLFNPTGPITWNNLTTLSISHAKLDEDLIANILSGSPLLDTLTLDDCYGYSLLNITSKSVKNLIFNGYAAQDKDIHQFGVVDDIIEINAPYISTLTISGYLLLCELLLLDVSSLVKADLDYIKDETPHEEEKEEVLTRFILRLHHVKELKIGIYCYPAFSGLQAKGFLNLKGVKVTFPIYLMDLTKLGDSSASDSSDGE